MGLDQAVSGYVEAVASLGARNLPPGGEEALYRVLSKVERAPRLVIDIGCNTGWVTLELARRFPRSRVVGIDIDAGMIAAARARRAKTRLGGRVQFLRMDCTKLAGKLQEVDLAISAGSTAFVGNRNELLGQLAKALSPQGRFIDMAYVYDAPLPASERAVERAEFGLAHGGETLGEYLSSFCHPGMRLNAADVFGRYELPAVDDGLASVLREIGGHEAQSLLQRVARARKLADHLATRRKAASFVFERAAPAGIPTQRGGGDELRQCMKVLDLFHTPVPRLPIEEIRRLSPYGFLAYIGDPDAAPGGSASVGRVAVALKRLGLRADSRVLDVGSFTGLSAFVLGLAFANVIGIDIDEEHLRVAKALGEGLGSRARFMVRDARDTGFGSGRFDAVVLTATLGYSPEPAAIVAEARRVLRRGGYFVEFLYDYPERSPEFEDHLRRTVSPFIRLRSMQDQIAAIASHGLECVALESIGGSQLPGNSLQKMHRMLVEREQMENPDLRSGGLKEFSLMVEDYVTGVPPAREPTPYLAVFRAM